MTGVNCWLEKQHVEIVLLNLKQLLTKLQSLRDLFELESPRSNSDVLSFTKFQNYFELSQNIISQLGPGQL